MKDGKLPRAKAALTADAVATTISTTLGSTPSSAYVKSTFGLAIGGRTGLTSLVVAFLFLITLFFSSIIEAISGLPAITAPAFIIVGGYMMSDVNQADRKTFDEAFPTFAVILSMPLKNSIATGIAVGFITYSILKLFSGKGKTVHPIVYIFCFIFIFQMIYFPGH